MRLSWVSFCLFSLSAFSLSCGSGGGSSSDPIPPSASPVSDSSTPALSEAATPESTETDTNEEITNGTSEAPLPMSLPFIYHPEEYRATREVFDEFGELTIDPSLISQPGEMKTQIVKVPDTNLPWAAYWYPKRDDQLFEGNKSPMYKLDDYLRKYGLPKGAQAYEKDAFNPNAADWEGLCDAWAVASVLTREPKAKIREMGIDFLPSDLKAIAIKYFEGYSSKIYGRRYLGSASTDGLIQDLRPEAFHKLVQVVIGEQQKPLIIDEDPGPEIWSKPLFRMSYSYTLDPENANAILVKAFPWMIRQRSSVTDETTSIASDLAAPQYEYRLYFQPQTFPLRIIGGEWIGASINFHPDMVFLPNARENSQQSNTGVRESHEHIRKLLVKVGMLAE